MGVSTKINRALDCKYRDKGFFIWYAKRLKKGDRCWAWSFWTMEWLKAEVIAQGKLDECEAYNLGFINNDGTHPRFRAAHYRIRPSWWFWFRRCVVLLVCVSVFMVWGMTDD